MKEYIYQLRCIKRLEKAENWTEADNNIVSKHFKNLVDLKSKGILLLAGKTTGQDKDTLGIVIFKADNYDEALNIMNNDPAIKEGIMTGFLQEYQVAILNRQYKKE